jgi:hypothetical protein
MAPENLRYRCCVVMTGSSSGVSVAPRNSRYCRCVVKVNRSRRSSMQYYRHDAYDNGRGVNLHDGVVSEVVGIFLCNGCSVSIFDDWRSKHDPKFTLSHRSSSSDLQVYPCFDHIVFANRPRTSHDPPATTQ